VTAMAARPTFMATSLPTLMYLLKPASRMAIVIFPRYEELYCGSRDCSEVDMGFEGPLVRAPSKVAGYLEEVMQELEPQSILLR